MVEAQKALEKAKEKHEAIHDNCCFDAGFSAGQKRDCSCNHYMMCAEAMKLSQARKNSVRLEERLRLLSATKKELTLLFVAKDTKISYGHRNDTLEEAYLRGRNEIINEAKDVLVRVFK